MLVLVNRAKKLSKDKRKKKCKMSNQKQGANMQTVTTKTGEKKIVDLSKFKSLLETKVVKTDRKERSEIYNYPKEITKELRSESIGKAWRASQRKKLERFEGNIFFYAKANNIEKLLSEIESFNKFYKDTFLRNDYSIDSITQSKDNAKSIGEMLQIIKHVMQA